MFTGCLIGMLVVAGLVAIKRFVATPSAEDVTPIQPTQTQEIVMETPLPAIKEPPLVFDNVSPTIEITDKPITSTTLTLKKNETLSGLLKRAKVPLSKSLEVAKALEIVCDIKKLQAGQNFEIFFIEDDFQGLKFENKKGETISVLKNQNNEFIPQSKEGIIENKRFVLNGTLQGTFSESAQKIGIPSRIVQQVILALDDKVDFSKDLKPSAPFKVIYEQKMTQTEKLIGKSQLLYVSVTTHTKTVRRYFFIDSMGVRGYYDENGQSTPQTIMKRPLGNVRVSSPFGMRLHPILGYQIRHKGVDFAAPLGTPVPAGADGVIQKIGRNGGYGKYIQIKHNDTYSTAYGHLNGYAADLKVGSSVKKGEIIGFVGSTGRSTGPHLHYEIVKNKEPVNPLKSTHTIPKRTLKNQSLEQFKKQKVWLDSLPPTPAAVIEKPQKADAEKASDTQEPKKEEKTETVPVPEPDTKQPSQNTSKSDEKINDTMDKSNLPDNNPKTDAKAETSPIKPEEAGKPAVKEKTVEKKPGKAMETIEPPLQIIPVSDTEQKTDTEQKDVPSTPSTQEQESPKTLP